MLEPKIQTGCTMPIKLNLSFPFPPLVVRNCTVTPTAMGAALQSCTFSGRLHGYDGQAAECCDEARVLMSNSLQQNAGQPLRLGNHDRMARCCIFENSPRLVGFAVRIRLVQRS